MAVIEFKSENEMLGCGWLASMFMFVGSFFFGFEWKLIIVYIIAILGIPFVLGEITETFERRKIISILELYKQGKANQEIAAILKIEISKVKQIIQDYENNSKK